VDSRQSDWKIKMARGARLRVLALVAALAGQAVLASGLVVWAPTPSDAQFLFGGDQGNNRGRSGWNWFEPRQPDPQVPVERPAPPPDYTRAPPPRKADPKAEAAVTTPILVLGDAMADWLGYGLEQAYADSPDIAILRRHKTYSGLIRAETKSDPRGEYPDWPHAARELITTQKPKFVLFMIGTNDRRQFREVTQPPPPHQKPTPAPAPPAPAPAQAAPQGQPAAVTEEEPAGDDKPHTAAAPAPPPPPAPAAPAPAPAPPVVRNLEFHTDTWGEAYSRRIDETIAALKTSDVPVFWVGLPPLRGPKASADMAYLNDLYRSRADKAGIIFIDVWDGFVDEEGRYVQYGPDVEGQTRRLRTGDGVYFTQAGARKLAHYVEREIQRWLNNTPVPVAVTVPEEPKEAKSEVPSGTSGPQARPLSGPVVSLTADRVIEPSDLLGGGSGHAPGSDAVAAKVLAEGSSLPAPAGRADDFAWPRRDVAPVDADPVVATTELPMTPMAADTNNAAAAPGDQQTGAAATAMKPVAARRPRPSSYADMQSQGIYRPDYRRPQPVQQEPWSFNSLFGSSSWWYRR
jgi:uncharacterized protein